MKYLEDIYFTNLDVVYNLGGYYTATPSDDWSCENDCFEQCKFYYVVEGGCVIDIDGERYNAKSGDWFFIPAKKVHSFYNLKESNFSKYWMHFDIYPGVGVFYALGLPYKVKVEGEKVDEIFREFIDLEGSQSLVDKLKIKACILRLIAEYVRLARVEGIVLKNRDDQRFDDLLRYINENLDKPLTINDLAEKYFVHPNHFIRVFKEKTGYTPANYVKNRKMETAKKLLSNFDLSVGAIAQKIGIDDSSYFTKLFKNRYNMTPIEYRKYYAKSISGEE